MSFPSRRRKVENAFVHVSREEKRHEQTLYRLPKFVRDFAESRPILFWSLTFGAVISFHKAKEFHTRAVAEAEGRRRKEN